jgi:hypothetical protein
MRTRLAIAVWLLFGGSALAQSPNPAEEAFEKGRQLAQAELYDRACAAFELSQRLDPQFGTLFNLAGCYTDTGKIAKAWILYKELSRSDTNAERRSLAAKLATQLGPQVPTVRVRVPLDQQSSDLRVFVGGTEVTSLLDVGIPFDAGRYVILATLPGYAVSRRELDLKAKQVATVDVVLERAPAVIPAASRPHGEEITAGKVMIATGAGLVAFGLVAGWRWYVNDGASPPASDRATTWFGTSVGSLLLGIADTAVGVDLFISARRSHRLRAAPVAGAGTAALAVSGAF